MGDSRPRYRRLRDCIEPGVVVLFVGINPGLRSAQTGHHFAGYSNRFWKLLYDSALVTEPLTHQEDWRLPEWGLGLTNLISRWSAGINVLTPREYQAGTARLQSKVAWYRPQIVALLGVTIYRIIFDHSTHLSTRLTIGRTTKQLAGVPVFLLPNPSGRNARYSYRQMLHAFRALRATAFRHRTGKQQAARRRQRTRYST